MNSANIVPDRILSLIRALPWGKINIMKAFLDARKRLLGVAAIFLLVLLMMNLNSRLGEYFRLDSERDEMSTQMAGLRLTHAALETRVGYATSDEAVEDWARNQAHLAQPEDKVVVVITPPGNIVTPEAVVTTEPRVVENWEIWWALFFGD